MGLVTKEISWEENTESETWDAKRLRRMFSKIEEHIQQLESVYLLPKSKIFFM